MNVLIVGNGGREHALAWKIKQSSLCTQLFVAPGNSGTGLIATNVSIPSDDFLKLGKFSRENKIDLIVVGPEGPLVSGIRDYFENDQSLSHILLVGPGKLGAQLEGSKDFSKQFMIRNNVPTAKAKTFAVAQLTEALSFVETIAPPVVLKADGLAAGKGVIICSSTEEAKTSLSEMLVDQKFGEASQKVLIEEFLKGIELSVFVLTDGEDYVILPEAKDYKRIGNNDTGLNTGGMGAVSPVAFADKIFMRKVEEKVIKPTVRGLKNEGIPYRGFIFIGIMNVSGEPFVIEYNARMGDPETEVVMPRIKDDFLELLIATASGKLKGKSSSALDKHAVTVFMVSGGYPEIVEKGKSISGLNTESEALVFYAGARADRESVITDGGRVLAVTGIANSLAEARQKAYSRVETINWDGVYYRSDIALDLLELNKNSN